MFQPKKPVFYTRTHFVVVISCISVLLSLLHVIAFIVPRWGVFEISSLGISTSVYYGLWSKCSSVDTERTVCLDWTSNTMSGALIATRFFGVVAVLTTIAAVLMFVLMALKNMAWKEFVIADIVLFFVTAALNFFTIITFIVTIVKSGESDSISWPFFFIVINTVASVIIGGYILLFSVKTGIFPRKRTRTDNKNQPKSTNLNSPRKIKVIKVEERPKIDEAEYLKNKEIIDSKII